MLKSELVPGKKYMRRRSTVIDGVLRTAESWIKCEEITSDGAIFSRYFEEDILLSNKQIEEELREKP